MVIHGDVDIAPAGAVAPTNPVLEDAFADLPEPAPLLDVQMRQLTRRGVLIPIRRRPRLTLGTRAAVPYQHPPDRRRRPAQRRRQTARPPPSPAAQLNDLRLSLRREPTRTPPRSRRAIPQPLPPLLLIPPHQPIRRRAPHPTRP